MSQSVNMITRENNAETAVWILGFENNTKSIVKDFILDKGMKSFLLHHDQINIPEQEHKKIEVLKRVMQKYDGDIAAINFGDMDNLD